MRRPASAVDRAHRTTRGHLQTGRIKVIYRRQLQWKRRTRIAIRVVAVIFLWITTVYVLTAIHVVIEGM
jgi:hypothetical protein